MIAKRFQENPTDLRQTKNGRRVIQYGEFIVQCPEICNEDDITGEVRIIRRDKNQVVFEGMMLNSLKWGYGIEYNQNNKVIYEGEFKEGKRQGWGRAPTYEGEFKQDQYDGYGRFISDDTYYEGYFTAGLYNGIGISIKAVDSFKGIEQLKNETKIQDFIQRHMASNSHEMFVKFNIEEIYIGQWAKGLKNGSGKLWKENGYWYTGQFAYDTIHGTGALRRSVETGVEKGIFYKGQFKGAFTEKM